MVGNQNHLYSGTFDGQGHTLTINWNTGTSIRVSPFQSVKNTTIKNLHVKGEIKSKADGLTGLINNVYGTTTISGCIIEVNLKAKTILAGMVRLAIDNAKLTITDCIVKGDFTVTKKGGKISGFVCRQYSNCTLTNCLYLGTNNANNNENYTFAGDNTEVNNCYYLNPCGNAQGTPITKEQLRSGEVAHLLQNGRGKTVWGQVLGTDTIPQLTAEAAKHVYEVKFTLNNEVKATRYANKDGKVILPTTKDIVGEGYNPHHYYALAFGDGFSASTTITEDRQVAVTLDHKEYYEIKNKDDWKAFCDIVESGQTSVDAKMTKDVDLGEDLAKVGTSKSPYGGTFDGQNHTLTVNWDAGSTNDVAPFGRVKGSTIKNLRTEGSIRSNGYYLSGLIDEATGENTVTGCVSNVNLTTSYANASCDAAGLICYIYSSGRITISDCLVKGSINATTEKGQKGMGGFVFIQHGSCIMNNCLYAGTNNASGGYTFASDSDPKATTTLNNCHYLNPCGKLQGEQATKAQLESGYMAHLLQGMREETVWGQLLGTDTIPQLTAEAAKQVYEVKFTLNGKVKAMRYANRGGHVSLPTVQELIGADYAPNITYALSFEGDFSASSTVTGNTTVVANVVFKDISIATKEDWRAFGDLVLSGERKLNAKLTADLNLGTEILKIGSESTGYSGTFDGQGHTVTVDWNGYGGGYFALFPFVTDATIKNLRVTGKMTSNHEPFGVFTLKASGTTTFSGCVSDVKITNGDKNDTYCAAGMVRAAYSKITFKDCIVAGDLNGTTDNSRQGMGGFVCGQADDATCTFDNCLYTGTNNAKGGYTFAPKPTLNNCYYLNACGTAQGTKITAEQLKSGEVTKKLQNNRTDKCYWAQQLGEMPDFYNAADKSKANYVYYDAAKKGWACDDFRLTDEQPLPIGLDFTAATVTYERNFNGTQKATLCLPYDLSAQGFKAYTLSGGNKNEVHFKETKDKLTAYTPYYITADGTPLLGGTNIEVKAYTGANLTTSANGYSIKGTVVSMDNATAAAANAYILQDDGMFHKVTTDNPGATVPAYHAYIICPPQASGAKQLSVVLDGETTGIGDVTNEATDGKNGPVYDLQGRRVADRLDGATRHSLPAGVYIVGGRKVVVK